MTILLPEHYHARRALEQSRVVCITREQALRQDIRPIRIGILNVTTSAQEYEFGILQPLGRSIIQIEPVWLRLETNGRPRALPDHVRGLYVTFEKATRRGPLDGLILKGPVPQEMPPTHLKYWDELVQILRYARRNIASTLGLGWGGFALAKMLGIEERPLGRRLFGIFPNRSLMRGHPIIGDTDDVFWCPQIRDSGIDDQALEEARLGGVVRLLSHSPHTGHTIFEAADQRYLMHLGHPEYDPEHLILRFEQEIARGSTDVAPPRNLDLAQPINTWRSHRNEFFTQWVKFIYDATSLLPSIELRRTIAQVDRRQTPVRT